MSAADPKAEVRREEEVPENFSFDNKCKEKCFYDKCCYLYCDKLCYQYMDKCKDGLCPDCSVKSENTYGNDAYGMTQGASQATTSYNEMQNSQCQNCQKQSGQSYQTSSVYDDQADSSSYGGSYS